MCFGCVPPRCHILTASSTFKLSNERREKIVRLALFPGRVLASAALSVSTGFIRADAKTIGAAELATGRALDPSRRLSTVRHHLVDLLHLLIAVQSVVSLRVMFVPLEAGNIRSPSTARSTTACATSLLWTIGATKVSVFPATTSARMTRVWIGGIVIVRAIDQDNAKVAFLRKSRCQ